MYTSANPVDIYSLKPAWFQPSSLLVSIQAFASKRVNVCRYASGSFYLEMKNHPGIERIVAVPDAVVPEMKMVFRG